MALPKRYDPKVSEPRWQTFWEEEGIFRFDPDDDSRPVYSVDTPPPTVSGAIHMGHVFSYVQAEALTRFWRQRGYNVFYPFGFDDNGLPSERFVEKKLKVRGRDMARAEFVELCLKTTREVEEKFKKLWQSLGFSADWTLEYSTIDELSQRVSQRSFLDLLAKDLVYRKETPALWCPDCRTAVAQAEQEDVEGETLFSDIAFELEDGSQLIIATTRPELLSSCVSVFVHPDDQRHRHLVGKTAKVPLFDLKVPVMTNEDVDMEKGTGVVMCCTFGDTKDIEWWENYELPLLISIDRHGKMTEQAGRYAGMKVEEARKAILEDLKANGLVLAQKQITHIVNTHERCGTHIEFLPAKQWFIRVLDFKEKLLEAGSKINWYPSSMKVRYDHWVEHLHWDWCISRQRFYGVPIPVWLCEKCDRVVPAREEDLPIDPHVTPAPAPCSGCGSGDLTPEPDILDTWATSSVTPQINVKWGEKNGDLSGRLMPMSMRPQAHDIIRTWAFYTIVKSLHHHGDVPWKDAVISGHVLMAERDEAGKRRKISKSRAHAFGHPEEIIGQFSADAIRYWACKSNLGVDTAYDEKMIQQGRRFVTKLWNASRFTLSHLEDFDGEPGEPTIVDRGLEAKLSAMEARATRYLEKYEFGGALREIESFFWSIFCDNYLEMVKGRLYEPETFGEASRRAGQATLHDALFHVLDLLAPFMPHVTEEIYQIGLRERIGTASIHLARWPEGGDVADEQADEAFDRVVDIVTAVRKHKSENNLSMGAGLKRLMIGVGDKRKPLYEAALSELRSTSRAGEIVLQAGEGEPSETSEMEIPLWIERED
jgi:valyl-tRNA synthetase